MIKQIKTRNFKGSTGGKITLAIWMFIFLILFIVLMVTAIASAANETNPGAGGGEDPAVTGLPATSPSPTDTAVTPTQTPTPESTPDPTPELTATLSPAATSLPAATESPVATSLPTPPELTPTPSPTPEASEEPAATPLPTATELPTTPFFETEYLVGIIDLTAGQIEPPGVSDEYPGEYYLDGRAAFYLKGKIKGRYLLTVRLDTKEGPLGEILERLTESDPYSLFEKIDPDRYYPVYGDDSTLINDAESQGPLYVRLEWDRSRIVAGNYRMDLNETELFKYNRGLYGLQMVFRKAVPPEATPIPGDGSGTQIFWANPLTLHSHDELLATGGALYYLKNADLVIGSEKFTVEARDAFTGQVIAAQPLEYGRDYDLDYVQGRLILKRSLAAIIRTGLITSAGPLDGNPLYLIADYEYENGGQAANANYGLRTAQKFGSLQFGATCLKDNTTTGGDYQLGGVDLSLPIGANFRLSAEWAENRQSFSHRFYSEDGGLTYIELPDNGSLSNGTAWKIGAKWTFPGESSNPLQLRCDYLSQTAGFSTPGAQILNNTQTYGLEFNGKLGDTLTLHSNFKARNEEGVSADTQAVVQLIQDYAPLKLTGELRYQDLNDFTKNEFTKELLGAVRLDYPLSEKLLLYAGQQLSLPLNDTTPTNNRTTLGVEYNLSPQTLLTGEASSGDQGTAALIGVTYQATPGNQVYSRIQYLDDPAKGQTVTTVAGNRGSLSETVELLTEYQTAYSDTESSTSELLGLDYTPKTGWRFWFNYTRSLVNSNAAARNFDRNIYGMGVSYQRDNLEYKTAFQLRSDDGSTQSLDQYLMTNLLQGRFNESLSYYAKLNYSTTQNPDNGLETARFGEGSLGIAYRPVADDRFNLLGEYTYLVDIAPSDPATPPLSGERSQILALDFIYDINPRWELGEKIAYKKAELRPDPNLDQWISNELYLWVNRLNYHLPFNWELSLEYRKLWAIQAQDSKEGFLAAVYYYFSVNTKLGGGYNFTSFNDDLVHLNTQAGGWFVNFTQQW